MKFVTNTLANFSIDAKEIMSENTYNSTFLHSIFLNKLFTVIGVIFFFFFCIIFFNYFFRMELGSTN